MELASLLIGIAVAGVAAYVDRRHRRRYDGLVERAEREFREIQVAAADPAMRFDARSAVIVDEQRDYLERSMQTVVRVRRYVRNAHGEYFFFLSEGKGRPYFKHIEQRAARAALGSRYVAPATGAHDAERDKGSTVLGGTATQLTTVNSLEGPAP